MPTRSCYNPSALVNKAKTNVVAVAQWQSASLWLRMLRVRAPSATPLTENHPDKRHIERSRGDFLLYPDTAIRLGTILCSFKNTPRSNNLNPTQIRAFAGLQS